jgi:sporulation protein YlmC with PRC-barrel domain
MTTVTVRVDELVGRRVVDGSGRAIGPIEEVVVDPQGESWTVVEYHVGIAAIVERLAASGPARAVRRLFRMKPPAGAYRIPWQRLDLSDPCRPILRGSVDDLARLDD